MADIINKYCAVIVAGGSGSRMKSDIPKQFLKIGSKTVLERSILAFEKSESIEGIVVVVSQDYINDVKNIVTLCGFKKVIKVVGGGDTRQKSVYNGLLAVPADYKYVLIHDGARPLLDEDIINNCILSLENGKNCAPGVMVKDTLKIADGFSKINATPKRDNMYSIQTPQCFNLMDILYAHENYKGSEVITDDCMLMEQMGYDVYIVGGNYDNIKITTPEDLTLAEFILNKRGIL